MLCWPRAGTVNVGPSLLPGSLHRGQWMLSGSVPSFKADKTTVHVVSYTMFCFLNTVLLLLLFHVKGLGSSVTWVTNQTKEKSASLGLRLHFSADEMLGSKTETIKGY